MLSEFERKDVSPLRYWVHAILPLVYDDSLSYYEVLAKVGQKMNEVIEGLNANNEQVEKVTQFTVEQVQNLTAAYNAFQQAMLDRQENFETKLLDEQHSFEMQLDGEIAQWEEDTTEKFEQQYQNFLSAYKRQFGVVQNIGNSETDVPSQKAWTNNAIVNNFTDNDANLCVGHNGIKTYVTKYNIEDYHIPYHTGELFNFNAGDIDVQLFWRTGDVTPYMWFRTHYTYHETWSPWKRISTIDDVVQTIGDSVTNVPSQKAWTNNAIVNNFTDNDANLCVGHNGIKTYVTKYNIEDYHIPYHTGELFNFNAGDIDVQLFWRTGDVTPYMWFRTHYTYHETWSPWKQISTIDDVVKEYDYDIVEWGDSITEFGGDTTSYGHFLARELGLKTVLNGGGSGDSSWDIAFRAGANPIVQKKGAVNGEYNYNGTKDIYGRPIQLLTNSTFELRTVNPLEINGQTVTFEGVAKENTFKLSGYQGTLEYDVPIGTAGRTHKGKITTIFTGTNNSTEHDAIIKYNNQIISLVPNNNYIVLGIYYGDVSNLEKLDAKMIAEYGVHFFDTRKELRENGLAIVDLTPNEQDISDASKGKISQQLLEDGQHLNEKGRKALGKLLALFIKARGFINY